MATHFQDGMLATAAYTAAIRIYPASLQVQRHTDKHLHQLRKSLQAIDLDLPSDVAIVARGSLARGDFCPFSDIDLTFVTSHAQELSAERIDNALVASLGGKFAVHLSLPSLTTNKPAWSPLFWVLHGLFIYGDQQTYMQFRDTGRSMLREMPATALPALWQGDLGRDYAGYCVDALRTNLKRGLGGIFDWDYINLVSDWAGLSRCRTLAYASALQRSRMMFWYLRALKFYLQTTHGVPRETPLEDHVRARSEPDVVPTSFTESKFLSVQMEHHRVVEHTNQLLMGG